MKMYEAAQSVLREHGSPMQVTEIYKEIINKNLFEFGAKDPVAILTSTLRKKSAVPANKGDVIFVKKGAKEFGLAEWE